MDEQVDGTRRKKIAVVTQYFPTSIQPWAGHSAYQTLRFLARRFDLKVFYPEVRYPAGLLTPKSGDRPELDRGWQPEGVATEYIPYMALPVVSRPMNGWSAGRALLPALRQFRPDAILNYVVYPDGLAAVRIGRALGVPVGVTAIGSDLNRISDPLCGVWTRRVLQRADAVMTVSGDLRQTAVGMGADPARSFAILNGCDTEVFRPRDRGAARAELGIGVDGPVVVYVGRMDMRKGLRELVAAAAAVRRRRPDLRCYLVGDGPDRGVVEAAIAGVGAEEWLKIMPAVQTEGVARWMTAADLVTLPSYKEGCPNVVLEALAAGRPMVATRVGGIPEIMDDRSGRLVRAMDALALAGALEEVLGREWDAEEIATMHSRSWAEVADDVEGVVRELLR
jgi:teichuronic acid biosynthesis glycosyltransferase TuaC